MSAYVYQKALSLLLALLEALDDPELFAPHFRPHKKHGDTWRCWRVFLRALFALPPEQGDLDIYTGCTGRTDWPIEPATEAGLVVGRRGGKSRLLATIAVFLVTFRDYEEFLAPGEVAAVSVIAADRRQARAIFRFASGLLKNTGLLAPMIADSNTEAITLTNRTMIEIGTASFRSVRGATLIAALCDEIAFWRTEESASNPDTEILRAIRPALGTIPGAILLMASSPYAKRGELYRTYREYFGKPGADVLVWKADTLTMNPGFPKKTVDREYEKDPESARAEYGAEFRDDLVDFISREAIEAITCLDRTELPPEAGVQYAAFCDPSGGSSDAMTLAIAHQEGDLGVLDAVLEIRAPFDPDVAVAECATLLHRYGTTRVAGDRYAGNWPVARFAAHGITFEQCARPKSDLYHDLLPLANARRVELLDLPRLAAQLAGLERRTARSGKDSIDHMPGGHDDVANAVAGVLVGLDLDRRPSLIPVAALLADHATALPQRIGLLYATLWVGIDGMSASATFAYTPREPLVLLDFECRPMSGAVIGAIATQLDVVAEEVRDRYARSVHTFLFVPAEFEGLAVSAMRRVFLPRLNRPDAIMRGVGTEPFSKELLADPVRLAFQASAHVNSGLVKLGPAARERSRGAPLLGALVIRAGEAIDADPLRLALLLGISIAFDSEAARV